MAGELAFFEIGVEDTERGRAFYEGLFDRWRFEPGPAEGFVIGAPNVRGGMHGGDKGASPYIFFRVNDMEAALTRVRELGGQVEEMDVEGRRGLAGPIRALQALPRRPGLVVRAPPAVGRSALRLTRAQELLT
jgi:predicted enzyme related to lactoylglutathione lyase